MSVWCRELPVKHSILDRLDGVTEQFRSLSFDAIRARAPDALAELLPGAQLEIVDQVPDSELVARGMNQKQQPEYREYYLGPPEPLWFIARGVNRQDAYGPLLELFFDRLVAALTSAGYSEELSRQARRDWLTGLPRTEALERQLQAAPRLSSTLAMLDMRPADAPSDVGSVRQILALRQFARSLRMFLTDGEQAFYLDEGRLALLIPESARDRFQSFFEREAASSPVGWARLAEAQGLEVVRLAEARQFSTDFGEGGVSRAGRKSALKTEESVPLKLLSGSRSIEQLAGPLLGGWHFKRQVTLIFDLPLGYALEAFGQAEGRTLIVTRGTSSGYLLDLRMLSPTGLVLEPTSLGELRSQLQQVADGERVYSGPLPDDRLLSRERDVWRLAAQGLENDEIAGILRIAPKTVSNYVSSLIEKLGLSHRSGLVLAYWDTESA